MSKLRVNLICIFRIFQQFFAELPAVRAKLEEAVGTIPISSQVLENQINDMFARLHEITVRAVQRRIRLKYLEHKVNRIQRATIVSKCIETHLRNILGILIHK